MAAGEGLHTEFKHKVSDPSKIISEMIAFANTEGGNLIIGVDDDRKITGLKFAQEESFQVTQSIKKLCRPGLLYKETTIKLSEKKAILIFHIPKSRRRPHFLRHEGRKICFVRLDHMSLQASGEMCEIIRRSKSKRNIGFTYGDSEKQLIQHLDSNKDITLTEFQKITGLKRLEASQKLISLVLADILLITPAEGEDRYTRAPDK